MFDWLKLEELTEISVATLLFRLVLAAVCGQCIAWISLLKTDRNADIAIKMTFVLMCILIAMATQIIGSNVARAFSLVGALSIVRFRTAMTSTQDVAFVLAAVVVGMAVGAGQYWVALLGLIILAIVCTLLRFMANKRASSNMKRWQLTIRATLGGGADWQEVVNESFRSVEFFAAQTARKGSAVEYEYRVIPLKDKEPETVLHQLSSAPQIESVSIRCETT